MGLFGRYVYAGGGWTHQSSPAPPYLVVDVHDSDIATIDYVPAGDGRGRCFLGFEPRVYFQDDAANAPVDVGKEARALAAWTLEVTGTDASTDDIQPLLASPDGDDPPDVFVEDTVVRLTARLGLPPLDLGDPIQPL